MLIGLSPALSWSVFSGWDGTFTDELADNGVTPVAITTSIATRQPFQRGKAVITLSGTYSLTGTPTGMAWRVGSGDWVQFAAETIGGGNWTGTLAIPGSYLAQGTLEVKPINGLNVTPATRSNITVSDVWVINGQSNADGAATNEQTYTKTNFDLVVAKSNNTWNALTGDPTGSNGGSVFPALAELIDAAGIPPVFMTGARVNGTGFSANDWNDGDGAYLTSISNMTAGLSKTGGCAGEIWWQGESDAVAGMTTQDYIDAWIARRDATDGDVTQFVGAPSYIFQIAEVSGATTGLDTIRESLRRLGNGEDARCRRGPNIITEQCGDNTHIGTEGGNIDTTEANAQLDRVGAMLYRCLYGSDSSSPTISSYSVGTGADSAKVTITFDRAMENHTRAAEWTVIDDVGTLTVSSAAQGSTTAQVVLTCSRALYGAVTVSFGEGTSAEVAVEDVASQLREATAISGVKFPPEYSYRQSAGTGVGQAPANTIAPSLGGSNVVGGTATATDGTYSGVPTPTVGSYQWQRSDNGTTGWSDISGATSASYVIDAADETKYIRRGEVASNAVGTADRAYTAASSQITNIPTPIAIFGSNVKVWTSTADASTLFQEISSESTPADAASEPIGTWRDLSGNSNHLRASTTGTRPVYKVDGSLVAVDFDGTAGDDFYRIPISMGSKRWLLAMAYKGSASNWIGVSKESSTSAWSGIGQSGSSSTTLFSLSTLNATYYNGSSSSSTTRGGHYTESQSATRIIMDITGHSTLTDPIIGKSPVGAFSTIGDLYAVVLVEITGAPSAGNIADLDTYLASVVA